MPPKKKKMFYMLENDLKILDDPKHDLERYTTYLNKLKQHDIQAIRKHAQDNDISEAYLDFQKVYSKKGKKNNGIKIKYNGIGSILKDSKEYIEKKVKEQQLVKVETNEPDQVSRPYDREELKALEEKSRSLPQNQLVYKLSKESELLTESLSKKQNETKFLGSSFDSQEKTIAMFQKGVAGDAYNNPQTVGKEKAFSTSANAEENKEKVNLDEEKQRKLKALSKEFNESLRSVCIVFEKVSENFEDLRTYLKEKDRSIIWEKFEDEILFKQPAWSLNYLLLERYKSPEKLSARKQYIGSQSNLNLRRFIESCVD